MSAPVLAYVLTALAALVVVLTRVRLARGDAPAGRLVVSRRLVGAHTVVGTLALVSWLVLLLGGRAGLDLLSAGTATLVGIVALALWWVTAVVGLMLLARWLPSRGRYAAPAEGDSWSRGPALSVLAHVGLVAGVLVFTYLYLVSAV